jgi:hypothetical protein
MPEPGLAPQSCTSELQLPASSTTWQQQQPRKQQTTQQVVREYK